MRILTDDETKAFFEKLGLYIGPNIRFLIDRNDESYVFRLIKDKVYYMSESQMKLAQNISKDLLLSVGTCFGKFTKSGKFRLNIFCLDYVSKYALHKVWVKPSGEQSYVYGNHIVRAHVARATENVPQYAGVVVYTLDDTPVGFGIAARDLNNIKELDPTSVVIFNQADVGEYLRTEDE